VVQTNIIAPRSVELGQSRSRRPLTPSCLAQWTQQ
jgi:hypothetical protein